MNVYLISGLGADRRTFSNLVFDSRVRVHHLDWIAPRKKETMHAYARRLAAGIDTSEPFCIIGLSFGGMLASEMITFLTPHKVVLLSSVNSYDELPFYYRWPGRIGIHRLIPPAAGKHPAWFFHWLFGVKDQKDKVLLEDVLLHTDPVFSRWAIDALLHWRKREKDSRVIRIHGDRDHVLPITSFTPDYLIEGGGHLLVINEADRISALLQRIIFDEADRPGS